MVAEPSKLLHPRLAGARTLCDELDKLHEPFKRLGADGVLHVTGVAFCRRVVNAEYGREEPRQNFVPLHDLVGGSFAQGRERHETVGVVIDGAVRDIDDIRKMNFPIFARHLTPTAGEPKGFGEINAPIEICGRKIEPGDWIIGDESGVVVVPKSAAMEMANRAIDVNEKENRIREEIQQGSTLGQTMYLKKWDVVK